MESVVSALADQQAEFDALLAPLDDSAWATPTPACPGWTIADVVMHMAQTDEAGAASASKQLGGTLLSTAGAGDTVDDVADVMVERERGTPPATVLERWRAAAALERTALAACDPHERVLWVSGELAARTLATTRLAETWIHSGDVAGALGVTLAPTDRLWHIARLAWRTLPYAFERAGATLHGPVKVSLTAPDGSRWEFGDGGEAATRVDGDAIDFCLVAARRREPAGTSLTATGPDADAVLALVRTYA
jgi:uncharacterized protein (TIGR03084 family)